MIVQAGGSEDMIGVAAEFAEVIFCAPLTLEAAQSFYSTLKGRLAAHGRTPDEMKILPGLSAVIGRTDAEAEENYEYLNSLVHPIVAREILSMVLGNVDLSPYPFDGPLPENLPRSNASLSIFQQVTEMARREKLTIRQVAIRVAGARAKAVIRGSPQTIADFMEEWFRKDALRRLQHHAAVPAGRTRRFRRPRDPGIAAARLVPHRIRRQDVARKSRSQAAGEPACQSVAGPARNRHGRARPQEDKQ